MSWPWICVFKDKIDYHLIFLIKASLWSKTTFPIKWIKCKFNNKTTSNRTLMQVNTVKTNWNSWRFKPTKISKLRYVCRISRTFIRILLVDLITHRRALTRYRCWTTLSCLVFWARDFSMSLIPMIMAILIRESSSRVSFAYIAPLLTRRLNWYLRSMILTKMVL